MLTLFLIFWAFGVFTIELVLAVSFMREEDEIILGDACAVTVVAVFAGLIWPVFLPLWFIAVNKDRVIWRRK
ncbi:hypothetical protein [Burkholderia cenocepacia]|uniref:hypothetical protein n=1 Tax=Burkholderia cenocepacia TaxID=95486 RepID=UPI001B94FA6A|nr:hypothetical protein [Burkholderia cenocepacia]MBR8409809.1 hypothetical protein [Burkholderia cenocepacia]